MIVVSLSSISLGDFLCRVGLESSGRGVASLLHPFSLLHVVFHWCKATHCILTMRQRACSEYSVCIVDDSRFWKNLSMNLVLLPISVFVVDIIFSATHSYFLEYVFPFWFSVSTSSFHLVLFFLSLVFFFFFLV